MAASLLKGGGAELHHTRDETTHPRRTPLHIITGKLFEVRGRCSRRLSANQAMLLRPGALQVGSSVALVAR